MACDVATFLRKKFIDTLKDIESNIRTPIPRKFQNIRQIFEDERFCIPPTSNFISALYDLNDALAEWKISTEQSKRIKKIFRHFSTPIINNTIDRLNSLETQFSHLEREALRSSSNDNQTSLFPSDPDRSTCFDQPDPSDISGFDEPKKQIVDWLDSGFRVMGVHGMGGSGKTTLVNMVLHNKNIQSKHKILWVCLSDLTCEAEINIKVIQQLLECLGCDIDGLEGYGNDENWLKQQLKDKLEGFESYILVFDDVWVCNKEFVDVCRELAEPKRKGGSVIVTSRIKEVAMKIVGGDQHKLIHLKPSTNGDILMKGIVKQNMRDGLILDVDDIVRHCHGLPQAAATLPNVVQSKPKIGHSHVSI